MKSPKVYLYPSLGDSYSMKRYLAGLEEGLVKNGIEYEIVRPSTATAYLPSLVVKYVVYSYLAFLNRNRIGKHIIVSERYSYLLLFLKKVTGIVVCHDLHTLYPEAKTSKANRLIYKIFIKCFKYASDVVCVSEHTLNDLKRLMPELGLLKTRVVHNGIEEYWVDHGFDKVAMRKWEDVFNSKRVILSVGTDAWYKNFETTLRILDSLEEHYTLIRVGDISNRSALLIEKLGLESRVLHDTNVTDDQLKYYYQNAHCLLFPSFSEGFGWPALEAELCGCPVVTTGNGAISEVLISKMNFFSSMKEALKKVRTPHQNEGFQGLSFIKWKDQVPKLLEV